jgi:hypothetical protein
VFQVHKAKLMSPGRWAGAPKDGIVAVKVQYPNALETMLQDLSNIRVAARFLQVLLSLIPFLQASPLAYELCIQFIDNLFNDSTFGEIGKTLLVIKSWHHEQ